MRVPYIMLFLILLSASAGVVDGIFIATSQTLPGASSYDLETVVISEGTISGYNMGNMSSSEDIAIKQNTAYTVLKEGVSGILYFKGKLDKVLMGLFGLSASITGTITWPIQAGIYFYYSVFLFQVIYRKDVDEGL
jgi:hypothetical protein